MSQLLGSILASATLDVMFDITPEAYFGTVPVGSSRQSLGIEIIITFLLMFVVLGVTSDSRAVCTVLITFIYMYIFFIYDWQL